MPKEKKKKKQKRVPDFQKTKLKVGRSRTKDPKQYQSLPKVQTISIAVQPSVRKRLAKNDEDERDEASPNDRIKVLLTRLRHYSATTRSDALAALHAALRANPALIEPNLAVLLAQLGAMLEESDAPTRERVARLFADLLAPRVDERDFAPFHALVLAHANSAVAHLNADVGRDALTVLVALARHYPRLVSSSAEKIFSTLVGFLRESTKTKKRTKSTRDVLGKLVEIFSVIFQIPDRRDVKFEFSSSSLSIGACDDDWIDSTTFRVVFSQFVSNLFDVWIDCDPSSSSSRGFNDDVTLSIMNCVVELLRVVVVASSSSSSSTWFLERYRAKILKHFVAFFPFGSVGGEISRSTSREKIRSLNFLFCRFALALDARLDDETWIREIFDYVVASTREWNFAEEKWTRALESILSVLDSRLRKISPPCDYVDVGLMEGLGRLMGVLRHKRLSARTTKNVLVLLNRCIEMEKAFDCSNSFLEAGRDFIFALTSVRDSTLCCGDVAVLAVLPRVLALPDIRLPSSIVGDFLVHDSCSSRCLLFSIIYYFSPELPATFYENVIRRVHERKMPVDSLNRLLRLLFLRNENDLRLQALQLTLLTGPHIPRETIGQRERPPEVRIRLFSRCLDEWNYRKTVVDSVSRINKEVTSDVQLEQLAQLLIKKATLRGEISEIFVYGVMKSLLSWGLPQMARHSSLASITSACVAFCGEDQMSSAIRSDLNRTIEILSQAKNV